MPLTYTNRVVKASGNEHPSLVDIAVGMSRQPRFGGQTRIWWSVLDHSLYCDELLLAAQPKTPHGVTLGLRRWRIGLLLHDAHEALTGDVPSPFKNDGLRDLQRNLDARIMGAFFPGGLGAYDRWHEHIAAIDRRAMLAEAQVVGAPVDRERILDLFPEGEYTRQDVTTLERLLWAPLPYWARPPLATRQETHPGVVEYLRRMLMLL